LHLKASPINLPTPPLCLWLTFQQTPRGFFSRSQFQY